MCAKQTNFDAEIQQGIQLPPGKEKPAERCCFLRTDDGNRTSFLEPYLPICPLFDIISRKVRICVHQTFSTGVRYETIVHYD